MRREILLPAVVLVLIAGFVLSYAFLTAPPAFGPPGGQALGPAGEPGRLLGSSPVPGSPGAAGSARQTVVLRGVGMM